MRDAELVFSQTGKGVLMVDGVGTLASSLLQKRLCCLSEADDTKNEFTMGPEGSLWMQDILENVKVRALRETRMGPRVNFQVYVFSCAAGACRIWWALPPLLHSTSNGALDCNWFAKHKKGLQTILEDCGLDVEHSRCARRAAITSQNLHELDTTFEGLALQFHSMTTAGLLTLLVHWQVYVPCKNNVETISETLAFMLE